MLAPFRREILVNQSRRVTRPMIAVGRSFSTSSSSEKSEKQEYSSSKEIGNPIRSVVSRYRNKGKEEDGESGAATSKHDRSARLSSAMQRLDFVTKTPEKQKEISKEFEDREF